MKCEILYMVLLMMFLGGFLIGFGIRGLIDKKHGSKEAKNETIL